MGQEVSARTFSLLDRQQYRRKVHACLDVFARMLSESRFHPERRSFGLEVELNLTDEAGDPALVNAAALEAIADPSFQTELGQFNVEINVPPRRLEGKVFSELEHHARASLNDAESRAKTVGAHMMIIGILPTVGEEHLTAESFSASSRYTLLNEQIFAARGEDVEISIGGVERLHTHADTIAPEAACTSVQLHQQVDPEGFAQYWNAAQAIAGVQVAIAANSPFFYGKELWRETRIALFEQATDTRPEELKSQGVRPRVWFGERWITSIFDLFEENVQYFPALLSVCEDEDPLETLERGGPRGWASSASTTAPSTDGTVPSTTSSATSPTCGSRTGSFPPGRRSSTSSPTRHSITACCVCCPTMSVRCGRRCRSRPPRRTSTPAPATGSRRRSTGPGWVRCRPPSSCSDACFRWRTTACSAGASTAGTSIAC